MLMTTIAEQVGAAMRGAGLRAESEQRARRLEQLEASRRELLARLVRRTGGGALVRGGRPARRHDPGHVGLRVVA